MLANHSEDDMQVAREILESLFADLEFKSQRSTGVIDSFYQSIRWPGGGTDGFHPMMLATLIQPDLGEQGFGQPDAVLVFDDAAQNRRILFMETASTSFFDASSLSIKRGEEGYNQTLKGKLELNYRLTLALQEYHKTNLVSFLQEPVWLSQQYQDINRTVKDTETLSRVVHPLLNVKKISYGYLILTTDEYNPLLETSEWLPELLGYQGDNRWSKCKSQFGWMNYQHLENFATKTFPDGLWLPTYQQYKSQLVFPQGHYVSNGHQVQHVGQFIGQGVSLVYIPEIDPHTYLHFSWKGNSCRLRKYYRPLLSPGTHKYNTDEYETDYIRPLIRDQIEFSSDRHRLEDASYWYEHISRVNQQKGLKE